MKLMCSEKRFALPAFLLTLALFLTAGTLTAQTRKSSTAKKPAATSKTVTKKTAAKSKDARKDSRTASKSKTNSRDKKATAKNSRSKQTASSAKTKKLSAKEQAKLDAKSKTKNKKESRRETAERRRQEAARRAAALAEQRRRERAAREARARWLAFERGLRTETVANIEKDNTEGEDLRIRKVAVEALGNRAGTVVVMESDTGKVLTMVNQDWAIRNSFKPCSVIKLVTGVAGINESVINGNGNVVGEASSINLDTALAFSKNPYFQRAGVKMGSSKMIEYAKDLGLGQKTGINAEGETPGRLPHGNNNPRIYSHGDDFEVTPLQLAVMVSALSNGGKKVVPQVQQARNERTAFRPQFNGKIDLPQEKYQGVIPGMIGAAEYGTARRGVDQSLGIAGKTGSCIGRGSWVGLFASVAPVENPKYAVVVITRGHSERGKYAAAVAGRIYRELAPRISRDVSKYTALKNRGASTPIDSRSADTMTDDEDDDAEAGDETSAEQTVVTAAVPQRVQPEPKKTVVKTVQSKPVFKPVVIPFSKEGAEKSQPSGQRPRVVKNEK